MYKSIEKITCLLFVFKDNYWNNAHNRRKFFVDFATQKGFDPLVAENWENVQYRKIIKQVRKNLIMKE